MSRRMKLAVSTIVAAVLSGVYWLGWFFFAETFMAADYQAGSEPSELVIRLRIAFALLIGPLLFAFLIALWRRLERRLIPDRDR